ncbi:MAG: DNA/RNA non-specific endonuclease [Acidobacteriota bacterium]
MAVVDARKILICALAALSLSLPFGCSRAVDKLEEIRDRIIERNDPAQPAAATVNIPLGDPSGASSNNADRDNYLITRAAYTLSYNNDKGTANWVAWKITAESLGESLRRPEFRPDPELPSGFRKIVPSDYSGSGYDRGHLVASADRFGDAALNDQTFYMTNVVPQTKDLNQFPWNKLEIYTRTLVRKGYDVYAIAGVLGNKGRLRKRVTIPASCWKILYIVPRGAAPSDSGSAKVIAVEMPNDNGIAHQRWAKYKTSVRALEEKTGYDFFSALPVSEQDRLETNIDQNAPR